MAKELLGTAVTDENGIATFTYTGQGRGKMNIVAESGELVSETFPVIDGIYKDSGTDVPKTASWYNQDSSFSVTPSSNGTLISCDDTSMKSLFAGDSSGWRGNFRYNTPLCVEFDVVGEVTGQISIYIMNEDNSQFMSHGIETSGSGHYKLIIDGEYVHKIKDGQYLTPKYAKTMDSTYAIGFRAITGSLTFKNFVIYPI